MTDHLLNLHGDVLAAMRRGPKHFTKLAFVLSEADEPADTELSHFRDRIIAAGPGDELTALWHRTLTGWDLAEQADWSTAPPRTDERRADTYTRLGFGADLRKALDEAVPVFKEPGPTVISKEFTSWYSRDLADVRSFYWNSYEQLLRRKGWSDAAVSSLDEASHAVVERLSDPTRTEAYGARGLVVGYVQSGKTANFTGVTAKAIDAGLPPGHRVGRHPEPPPGPDPAPFGHGTDRPGEHPARRRPVGRGRPGRHRLPGRRGLAYSSSATVAAPPPEAPSTSNASLPGTTTTRVWRPESGHSNSTSRSVRSRFTPRTTCTARPRA